MHQHAHQSRPVSSRLASRLTTSRSAGPLAAIAALMAVGCQSRERPVESSASAPPPVATHAEENRTESTASGVTLAGFSDTLIFSGLNKPTAARFASNGKVFVAEKGGRILLFDSLTDTTPTVFADLSGRVNSYWDRGLNGLALHPNYPATPHVFVFYAHDTATNSENGTSFANRNGTDTCPDPPGGTKDGCVSYGRLARIVDTGSYPITSETVLITEWPQQFPGHSVGHIAFGPDGYLYATGGDGALHNTTDTGQWGIPVNPLQDPSGWGGALRVQSLRRGTGQNVGLNGALIRVDPNTGDPAPGNPNSTHADIDGRRILAQGFRTPFRFTVHPTTGEVWVGDVGAKEYDEINRVAIAAPAENFGWPCYEGPAKQPGFDGLNLTNCENLYTTTQAQAPYFSVKFNTKVYPNDTCTTIGNTAISGLAFYQGGNYPSSYDNALFFSDYSRSCIWVMYPGTNGLPNTGSVQTFVTGASSAVDLQVGPNGDLFYVSHGNGQVRRLRYQAPTAVASANPTVGAAPLQVTFSAAGSIPVSSGDTLTYAWDFDSDDQFDDATGVSPQNTFPTQGTFAVRVRVTDQASRSDVSSPVTIIVGSAPTGTISTPEVGSRFVVGQVINFSGSATDPEDGPLPASALSWELFVEHCPNDCHTHSVTTWDGVASGSFPAPDHEFPSYLRLVMRARDSSGITTFTTREIHAETVNVTFNALPGTTPPLQLGFNFEQAAVPFTRTVMVGSTFTVSASSQIVGGTNYGFSSWSDGGGASHTIVAPATATTYTATFAPSPWTSQDIGAVAAAGSHTQSGEQHTVKGSGADIYGAADEFHFVHQALTGDGSITARVVSLTNPHTWTKAGVMMRDGTAAGARNVMTLTSPTAANLYRFQRRTATNGTSTGTAGGNGAVPVYLKIDRTGNVFSGFTSVDGINWTAIGAPLTMALPATILVGLAVTSHVDGTLATAVFDNVTVTRPAPPTKPEPPTGLTGIAGDRKIDLTWTPPAGPVTSYTVKRADVAGGPYTPVASGIPGTSYSNTGLDNGRTYYYVVSASNAAGEGNDSGEISAVPAPPPLPGAPGNLNATAGNAKIDLSWTAATGVVSGYTVKRSTVASGPYTNVVTGVTGLTYSNTGLTNGTRYYYVVAASNSGGEGPSSTEVSAIPTAPPVTWSSVDVGAVARAGSFSESSGTFTVNGSGADIYGTADEFRYVYRTISGNMTITARVVSVQNVNTWTKAGVMMRETTAAGSRNVMALVSPTNANSYRLQARTGTNGSSTSVAAGPGTRPVWLRLVRNGTMFTASYSTNGTTYSALGSPVTLSVGASITAGLAITSHVDGTLATAVFDNVTITTP